MGSRNGLQWWKGGAQSHAACQGLEGALGIPLKTAKPCATIAEAVANGTDEWERILGGADEEQQTIAMQELSDL